MARNKDVTDEQRADFQRRVSLLVHALLDSLFNRVEVEHTQHSGTYYSLVRAPNNRSGFTNETLQHVTKIATKHKATISVDGEGSLVFWLQVVEGE